MLGQYGYDKEDRKHIFNLIDWIIKLPKDLEPQFLESTVYKDKNMEYVNTIERYAIEKGLKQGLTQGIEQGQITGQINMLTSMLEHKFGSLPYQVKTRINKATPEQIKAWSLKLIDAETMNDVFG